MNKEKTNEIGPVSDGKVLVTAQAKRMRGLIISSFLELLKHRSFESIKKSQICKKAEISPSTFYRYFLDKYDLVKKIIEQYVNDFLKIMAIHYYNDMDVCFRDCIAFISHNAPVLRNLLLIRNKEIDCEKIMIDRFLAYASEDTASSKANDLEPQVLATLLCATFMNLISLDSDTLDNQEVLRNNVRESYKNAICKIFRMDNKAFNEFLLSQKKQK